MADPNNFLINTDYPLDMICFKTEGSTAVADGTFSGMFNVPHGLSFVPMPFLFWSNTSDFAISNVGSDSAYYASGAGQDYRAIADSTNITILLSNASGSSKTLYYRIFCFVPSTISEDTIVTGNSDQSDNFLISTDYNYMKLLASDRLTPSIPTYSHNLGDIPTAVCWGVNYSSGTTIDTIDQLPFRSIVTDFPAFSEYPYLTNSLIVWENPAAFDALEFRLYADRNG